MQTTVHKPTQAETLAAQLEDMDETFVQRYYEIEKLALEQLKPTPLEHSFNWKRTVQVTHFRWLHFVSVQFFVIKMVLIPVVNFCL